MAGIWEDKSNDKTSGSGSVEFLLSVTCLDYRNIANVNHWNIIYFLFRKGSHGSLRRCSFIGWLMITSCSRDCRSLYLKYKGNGSIITITFLVLFEIKTRSLYHCIIVSLYYQIILLLYHFSIIVPLYHCIIVSLYNVSLYNCIIESLYSFN